MERDFELPAGFQDADFEMRNLELLGQRSSALKKRGICDHGWLRAPEGQPAECLHCHEIFSNIEEACAERAEILA